MSVNFSVKSVQQTPNVSTMREVTVVSANQGSLEMLTTTAQVLCYSVIGVIPSNGKAVASPQLGH